MPQVGFIRSKQELKFLILYIAERLVGPVTFVEMQDVTMRCDPAIDFFEFSECMNALVETEHLALSDDERYTITDKGVMNGRATAEEIPYSVRLAAEKLIEGQNQKLKRARQVRSNVVPRANGTFNVQLRFNDDDGRSLWRMELAVPGEKQADALVKRFQAEPETMYGDLIRLLFPDKPKQEDT